MLKLKRKHLAALFITAVLLITTGFGLDNRLQTTDYDIVDIRVPAAFEGYKIVQLSDLHCAWFGDAQQGLIVAVSACDPNIIVLTGDIIDAQIKDYESVAILFDELTQIAPVIAVSGNHENGSRSVRTQMDTLYKRYNVTFLNDTGTTIVKDKAAIEVYGLEDRAYITRNIPEIDADTYGILLFHRSYLFDDLSLAGYGLIFSGHGHGGLIRLPFIGGGIVTADGALDFHQPYTGGLYTANQTALIANRGLVGSHHFPRIFNRPEIVCVTLHHVA